ncbi:MAG TPA: ABC transporter ATP-binding protein [Chitinophagaceae bacterium]
MNITLDNAGKKFNRDWIFRNFSYTFTQGNHYAIVGPNGSGKSTLLQVLAASMNPTEGSIRFSDDGSEVPPENVYRHLAIAAPYLELVEEMTAAELLSFHAVFKTLTHPVEEILQLVQLDNTRGKQVRNFSSGMKQRLKLAQAIFSDTKLLLLDEPCTNLDAAGYQVYQSLIKSFCLQKLVIVSSNDLNEYSFCEERINMLDHKYNRALQQ